MEEQLKIIYLHGFNSSAESKKSKILESYLKKEELINFESPNLNNVSIKSYLSNRKND